MKRIRCPAIMPRYTLFITADIKIWVTIYMYKRRRTEVMDIEVMDIEVTDIEVTDIEEYLYTETLTYIINNFTIWMKTNFKHIRKCVLTFRQCWTISWSYEQTKPNRRQKWKLTFLHILKYNLHSHKRGGNKMRHKRGKKQRSSKSLICSTSKKNFFFILFFPFLISLPYWPTNCKNRKWNAKFYL